MEAGKSGQPPPSPRPVHQALALPGARAAILWSLWIAVVAGGFLAQFIERVRPMLHHP